jgi:hypothetical protein
MGMQFVPPSKVTSPEWRTFVPNNEYGDFQTPRDLAAKVLATAIGRDIWPRVLEPTCGTGNFLHEAAIYSQAGTHIIGLEIQPHYAQLARGPSADVLLADIFAMHLGRDLAWRTTGPLLVVGNPPWVTNSQLSRLDSKNRPDRVNLKNLNGYDAMTGSSNFDIAEYIWLKLITELKEHSPTISLLCKTQVARNVLEYCAQFALPVSDATLHLINAKKWFNVAVDAGLFTLRVNSGPSSYLCKLYESLDSKTYQRQFGVVDGKLVADVDAYIMGRHVEGSCQIEWRQGLKHDASAVMELTHSEEGPRTSSGVILQVEDDYLFPLLKCTDVFRGRIGLNKWVVVPQKTYAEDTARLARTAPRLWQYLNDNALVLDGRKSSIYRNRPRFSVFGLGGYSFAPYKIAISGLHKAAGFRLVGPIADKPVFFDDTCYILPFDDPVEAAVVLSLLEAEPAQRLLSSLAFFDSKRPINKKLLQRIDLLAASRLAGSHSVIEPARNSLYNLGISASPDLISDTFLRLQSRWAGNLVLTHAADAAQEDRLF